MLNTPRGLKEILIEPEGIYRRTQIQTGTIVQIDYNMLAKGIELNDDRSAIAESHSSNSYMEKMVFAYMVSTPKELAKRYEEQSRVH